jgi:hypothetical protein
MFSRRARAVITAGSSASVKPIKSALQWARTSSGGVIFELATDSPGFATDEAEGALGRALKLPAWLEPRRAHIESVLPAVTLPDVTP